MSETNDEDDRVAARIKKYTANVLRYKIQRLTDQEIIDAANAAPFKDMVTADDYLFIVARAVEGALLEKLKEESK